MSRFVRHLACTAAGASLLVVATLVTACSGPGAGSSVVDRVKSTGEITMASFDDPPFSTVDPQTHELVGLIPEILREALDRSDMADVEIKPVVMPFSSVIPALQSGRVDAVADIMAVTDERKRVIDFVDPFMLNPEVAVVAKGNPHNVHAWTDMRGLRCGSWEGSIWAGWCAELGNTNTKIYPSFNEMFQDIAAGRIDGGFVDRLTLAGVLAANPDFAVQAADPYQDRSDNGNPVSIAVRKDSTDLKNVLNSALAKMESDGTLVRLFKNYNVDPNMLTK